MPKKKEARKLPPAASIASNKPLIEEIAKRKDRVAKVRTAISKDGKYSKYDPKYRQALKRLKRTQRKVRKEVIRLAPRTPPKETAAAAAPAGAAPAAAAPAAEAAKA